jgi:hypothetical protein
MNNKQTNKPAMTLILVDLLFLKHLINIKTSLCTIVFGSDFDLRSKKKILTGFEDFDLRSKKKKIIVGTIFCLQPPRAAHALCSDQNIIIA